MVESNIWLIDHDILVYILMIYAYPLSVHFTLKTALWRTKVYLTGVLQLLQEQKISAVTVMSIFTWFVVVSWKC